MQNITQPKVGVLGIPFDENSSYLKGTELAPPTIRKIFHSDATNRSTENLLDLGMVENLTDLGDLEFGPELDAFKKIEETVEINLNHNSRLLCLGGDHSITYPILKAYSKVYPRLNILHMDAHPDLYDDYEGNRFSHACPFARICEENLAQRIVQIGIRAMNTHQFEQSKRFGVETIELRNWDRQINFQFDGPIYISLDMDVLDPAFAPGVSHPEAGGLSTRDVLNIIQNIEGTIIGADLVEYNPNRDFSDITSVAAAKLMKELIARLLE